MKIAKKIILCLVVLVIGIISFIYLRPESMETHFKLEYESLNGKNDYIDVNIPSDNNIVYADYEQIFDILDGTGVIYFGYPECPWCRNAVPVLIEAAKEAEVDQIYYLNNNEDRDTKTLKDGKVVTEKEGTDNYNKLLEKLGDKASTYEGLEDNSIKRLYFPTLVVVKNGEITDYIEGTVDSQKNPQKPLNEKQKKELKDKYTKAMKKLKTCNQNSKC